MLISTPMIGIALYDYDPQSADLKRFLALMEDFSQKVGVPWESIGLTTSAKLIQFKNGKRKIEKNNFEGITDIGLMGGVYEPGTNEDWQIYAYLSKRPRRDLLSLCFEKRFLEEGTVFLEGLLKELLRCAAFRYGIVYERIYNERLDLYAAGAIGTINNKSLPDAEEERIAHWMRQYSFPRGSYKTGLLRDVYPHNIFVETHLTQMVGDQTLRAWIEANENHGRLEKLTSEHWIWSLDPDQIPHAQETLQEAGLLLCYKV